MIEVTILLIYVSLIIMIMNAEDIFEEIYIKNNVSLRGKNITNNKINNITNNKINNKTNDKTNQLLSDILSDTILQIPYSNFRQI
jgi:hypothetical protein